MIYIYVLKYMIYIYNVYYICIHIYENLGTATIKLIHIRF